MDNRLSIAVCANLGGEAEAVRVSEGFSNVDIVTFPAHCLAPQNAWAAIDGVLDACEPGSSKVIVLGGCRVGVGSPPPGRKDCSILGTEQCFHLVASKAMVDAYQAKGAYLLTPGWLVRWREQMAQWQFTDHMAREFFAESAARLVLLDTGVYENSDAHLKSFSDFVNLPHEIVPVGLDFFRLQLLAIVQQWRLEREQEASSVILNFANRKSAEHAMVYDVLGRLSVARSESQVVAHILDLFQQICAPSSLVYVSFENGQATAVQSIPDPSFRSEGVKRHLNSPDQNGTWTESGTGFFLRIMYGDETVGGLEIDGINMPQYRDHYLNIALAVVSVFGIAIANARANDKIAEEGAKLREALDQIRTLQGIIPICASCKKIRTDEGYWEQVEVYVRNRTEAEFSHCLCPSCMASLYPEYFGEKGSLKRGLE